MYTLITSIAFLSLLGVSTIEPHQGNILVHSANSEVLMLQEDFTGSFLMEVTEMKNGKPAKNKSFKIAYYIDKNKVAMIPQMEDGQTPTMIYNLEDKTILTLMDQGGNKVGIKMKMPNLDQSEVDADKWAFNITPTDEQKEIDGYTCKKYLMESEESSGYAWVTEEVAIDYEKIFNFLDLGKKGKNSKLSGFGDMKGMALEAYTKSKGKEEAFEMKIKDLVVGTVDKEVFDVSEYSITNMSGMGGN